MNTGEQAHTRLVERQRHNILRQIRRKMNKSYSDYCIINSKGLDEETIQWLEEIGYRVYSLSEI